MNTNKTIHKIIGGQHTKGCPYCGGKLQKNKFEHKHYCTNCGNAYNQVELEELRGM